MNLFDKIWNYKLINLGKNSIYFSNATLSLLLVIIGIRYFTKFTDLIKNRVQEKFKDDRDAANAVEKIFTYVLSITYVILILEVANMPLSTFAFVGSALVFSIGLGAKTIMNNLLSGLIVMIERPVKIGDIVQVEGIVGKVRAIGARCMVIRNSSGVESLIPNSKLLQNTLFNYTAKSNLLSCTATLVISTNSPDRTSLAVNLEQISKELYDQLTKQYKSPILRLDIYLAAIQCDAGIWRYTYTLTYNYQLVHNYKINQVKHNINLCLMQLIPNDFTITHNDLTY